MMLLGLVFLLPLTACHSPIVANDTAGECDHPEKPKKPYTDKKAALYIVDQGKAIDTCRALLGSKPRL